MRLTHANGRWEAISSFAEKDISKSAGMRWDAGRKCWYTDRPDVAIKLAPYADELARTALATHQERTQAAVAASRATDADIEVPCPEGLAYMPFQRAGIAYALGRINTIIADEMGLGKTIQAIGVINADPTIKRVLVIAPASLKLNWKRELERWLTRPLTVGLANGALPATEICIINYDIIRKHDVALKAQPWDLMIADECHYLKSHKAKRTQGVLGHWDADPEKRIEPIPAKRRIYMTGTPIVNRPIELWSILHSMGWKSWRDYVVRYCAAYEGSHGWDVSGASHLDELQEKLRSTVMVRRLKKDVLTELPAKRRQIIELPSNGCAGAVRAEQDAWTSHHENLEALQTRAELAKASDDDDDYRMAVEMLRSAWGAAFEEMARVRHEVALAKVPQVVEHLLEAVDSSDKVILFCHHHDVENAYCEALTSAGVGWVKLTGEMTLPARQASVDAFQTDPAVKVFIGGIQAAGVGITLTAASHVVFAELDWVPGNMSQAEDRCHRIGQTESVLVQHLVLEGSLDAVMARRLVAKQAVIDAALDTMATKAEPGWGMLMSAGDSATHDTPRAKIAKEAETITPEEAAEILRKLRIVAGMCDGARELDGTGFSKIDVGIGHSLAAQASLSLRQAALGKKLVAKYHRQLGE